MGIDEEFVESTHRHIGRLSHRSTLLAEVRKVSTGCLVAAVSGCEDEIQMGKWPQ
jgi:hypothetical protein